MSDVVLKVKRENFGRVKNLLLKDERISRCSIEFRSGESLGIEGEDYYFLISGPDDACNAAKNVEGAEVVGGEEERRIKEKMREDIESAASGFGFIME